MYLKFSHYIKIEKRRVRTYGIVVIFANVLEIRRDVSTDGKAVKELVRKMNKEKIELVHLDSIFEDFYLNHY